MSKYLCVLYLPPMQVNPSVPDVLFGHNLASVQSHKLLCSWSRFLFFSLGEASEWPFLSSKIMTLLDQN